MLRYDFIRYREEEYRNMWLPLSAVVYLAYHDADCMTDDMMRSYIDEMKAKEKANDISYIFYFSVVNIISKLDPETLHASYVSLLAQHEQEQAMASIKRVKQAKESYYQKYGRWYDKFISYLK